MVINCVIPRRIKMRERDTCHIGFPYANPQRLPNHSSTKPSSKLQKQIELGGKRLLDICEFPTRISYRIRLAMVLRHVGVHGAHQIRTHRRCEHERCFNLRPAYSIKMMMVIMLVPRYNSEIFASQGPPRKSTGRAGVATTLQP